MSTKPNVIDELADEHLKTEKIVADLRNAIQAVLRGERAIQALKDTFVEFVELADEELIEHFDKEEQIIFPFIAEKVPEAQEAVLRMEGAHDRMCGALSRMHRIIEEAHDEQSFEEQFDMLVSLFSRFDANFSQHSDDEHNVFLTIGKQLAPADLQELQKLLASI